MGANPSQALALVLFLAGSAVLAASLFYGGSIALLVLGLAGYAASVAVFLRAKPLENVD